MMLIFSQWCIFIVRLSLQVIKYSSSIVLNLFLFMLIEPSCAIQCWWAQCQWVVLGLTPQWLYQGVGTITAVQAWELFTAATHTVQPHRQQWSVKVSHQQPPQTWQPLLLLPLHALCTSTMDMHTIGPPVISSSSGLGVSFPHTHLHPCLWN